jgi:hypothetical protein
MDVFSRTFLPAAAEGRLGIQTTRRHLPVLRRCVGRADTTVLVGRCGRPGLAHRGDYVLLLTRRRLVLTQQTGLLHRVRLHLNAELRHLGDVTWSPDPRRCTVELAVTAIDGVRERFAIRVADLAQLWRLDALLGHVFRSRGRGTHGLTGNTVAPHPVAHTTGVDEARTRRAPVLPPVGRVPRLSHAANG